MIHYPREALSPDESERLHQRAESLLGLIRIMSLQSDLDLRILPSAPTWSFNFKTKEITAPLQNLLHESFDYCRGLALHESAHATITRIFDIVRRPLIQRREIHSLFNVIEDCRIETWMGKRSPGSLPWIKHYNDQLFTPMLTGPLPQSLSAQYNLAILTRWWFKQDHEDLDPQVLSALDQTWDAITQATLAFPPPLLIQSEMIHTLYRKNRTLMLAYMKSDFDDPPDDFECFVRITQLKMVHLVINEVLPIYEELFKKDQEASDRQERNLELDRLLEQMSGHHLDPRGNVMDDSSGETRQGASQDSSPTPSRPPTLDLAQTPPQPSILESPQTHSPPTPTPPPPPLPPSSQISNSEPPPTPPLLSSPNLQPSPHPPSQPPSMQDEDLSLPPLPQIQVPPSQLGSALHQSLLESLNTSFQVDPADHYLKVWGKLSFEIDLLAEELIDVFQKKTRMKWLSGYSNGSRLDIKKAMEFTADPRLYNQLWQKKSKPQKIDPSFTLVVDTSGSMDGSRIEGAFEGLVLLAEVCLRLKIPLEIISFDNDHTIEHEWDEDLTQDKRLHLGELINRTGGRTNLSGCLEALKERLKEQPTRQHIVFILSDGMPNDSEATHDRIQQLENQKIVCIGLGIGPDTEELAQFLEVGLYEVEPSEIAEELAQLIRNQLLKS